MVNAKTEFLGHTQDKEVLCVSITHQDCWNNKSTIRNIKLKHGYTLEDYELFIQSLDFNYDSGYGGQELFGTIWYKDGTWCDRGEYDGSEWWNHHMCPVIPKELLD
jgi:hypothetical protein